jgi:hypothetical protein
MMPLPCSAMRLAHAPTPGVIADAAGSIVQERRTLSPTGRDIAPRQARIGSPENATAAAARKPFTCPRSGLHRTLRSAAAAPCAARPTQALEHRRQKPKCQLAAS